MILKRFINHCKRLWGFTRILVHEKTPMAIVIVTATGETPFNNLKLTVYESC